MIKYVENIFWLRTHDYWKPPNKVWKNLKFLPKKPTHCLICGHQSNVNNTSEHRWEEIKRKFNLIFPHRPTFVNSAYRKWRRLFADSSKNTIRSEIISFHQNEVKSLSQFYRTVCSSHKYVCYTWVESFFNYNFFNELQNR